MPQKFWELRYQQGFAVIMVRHVTMNSSLWTCTALLSGVNATHLKVYKYASIFYSSNALLYTSGLSSRSPSILVFQRDMSVLLETDVQHLSVSVPPNVIFQMTQCMECMTTEARGLISAKVTDHKRLEVTYYILQFAHIFIYSQLFLQSFCHSGQNVDI